MIDDARQIENLLYTYAEYIDLGNFEGIAELFRHAVITSPAGGETQGYDEVLAMYQNSTRLYPDTGTPHTKHVTSNPIIEVDGDKASCRSYFTVLQSLPDLALQPIISGRYHDEFEKVDGNWHFSQRMMLPELFGDLSQHLLFDTSELQ